MTQLTVRPTPNIALTAARVERALARAVGFLRQRQLAHGEFQTYAAADEWLTTDVHPDSALFVTALVLYAIGSSDDPRAAPMLARGLDFLAAEMEGPGLWRYWSSRHALHRCLPPDLDDTCCISFLLKRYARPLPSNQSLLLANRDAQGLFYTWLAVRPNLPSQFVKPLRRVSNPEPELVLSLSGTLDTIDCAVNANVLLYLGERAATQPAADYLIETVVDDRVHARSTYYLHSLSFYYLLSRAYANGVACLGKTQATLVKRLAAAQADSGSFGNPLLTALAACTLLNIGAASSALERAVRYLLQCQNADGSWARHAMFLGPAPYYGSEELTTALCVEALLRYHAAM